MVIGYLNEITNTYVITFIHSHVGVVSSLAFLFVKLLLVEPEMLNNIVLLHISCNHFPDFRAHAASALPLAGSKIAVQYLSPSPLKRTSHLTVGVQRLM